MIIVSQYTLEEDKDGYYHVRCCEIRVCPVCGQIVFVIGTRKRLVILDTGEKQTLIIRRLRCKGCRVIHHELPDIIVPFKRHCADTVEKVICGDDGDVCCEGRTIRRLKEWWVGCLLYFESILASLREKYGVMFSLHPAPREMIRAVVNANLWVHTRSASLSG